MSHYFEWNDGLAAHFFRSEMAGKPVHLCVDRDAIVQAGRRFSGDVEGFLSTVKEGSPWATHRGLCQRALQTLEGWRDRDLRYPPYIAYLTLFVLAAGVEGEFAPHAYYPRLRSLLGEGPGGVLPSFDRMLDLWDDLERWSVRDKNGELGLFEAAIAGNWIHVGLPIAQTLLTERERRALPLIFSSADLDPTAPPSDSALAELVRVHGREHLRQRTAQLLATRSDQDLFEILIDAISNELAEWDGEIVKDDEPQLPGTARVFSSLRLGLAVDLTAASVRTVIRCRLNREFPDHRMSLRSADGSVRVQCEEFLPGWSSPLVDSATQERLDGSRLDWLNGALLTEERLSWRLRLPARRVRTFVEGDRDELPDLIETHRLQRRRPFLLLFHDSVWHDLREWTEADCQGFQTLRVAGLRPHWQLARCAGANSDTRVCSKYSNLSFSDRVRVRFVDGIRASAGNSFFAFATPKVYLDGGEGNEEIRCNGIVLKCSTGDNATFTLPPVLPTATRIPLEVVREGRSLARSSFYLIESFEWQKASLGVRFNGSGERASEHERATIAGALVDGQPPDTSSFALPVLFTPGLDAHSERRIFFIGRRAGEIVTWPQESLPADWRPVWAVSINRNGRAFFCGAEINSSEPLAEAQGGSERLELWKEILWRKRRRIVPPANSPLSGLWRRYQECARNVG